MFTHPKQTQAQSTQVRFGNLHPNMPDDNAFPRRVSCAPRLLPALFAQKTRKNNACSAGYFHLEFALVLSRSVRVKSKHKNKGTFALQKVEVCGLRAYAYVCFGVTHVRGPYYCIEIKQEINRATRVKRKISNKKNIQRRKCLELDAWYIFVLERARACIALEWNSSILDETSCFTSFKMLITLNHTLYLTKCKYIIWPASSK